MLRTLWKAVGIAGDIQFLIVVIGGIAVFGAVGTGLLAALTSIAPGFLVIASIGLVAMLIILVPLALRATWLHVVGPALVVGDWRARLSGSAKVDEITITVTASVWNGLDAGGDRATARGVVLELEVFDLGGRRMFHHVGWESYTERDFPPTRVEEVIKIASKVKDDDAIKIGWGIPLITTAPDSYEGKLTLRGRNIRRPATALFSFGSRPDGTLWVRAD